MIEAVGRIYQLKLWRVAKEKKLRRVTVRRRVRRVRLSASLQYTSPIGVLPRESSSLPDYVDELRHASQRSEDSWSGANRLKIEWNEAKFKKRSSLPIGLSILARKEVGSASSGVCTVLPNIGGNWYIWDL